MDLLAIGGDPTGAIVPYLLTCPIHNQVPTLNHEHFYLFFIYLFLFIFLTFQLVQFSIILNYKY